MKSDINIKNFINLKAESSSLNALKTKFKEVFYLISKVHSNNLLFETISIMYNLLVLISLSLNKQFIAIWNPNPAFERILLIMEYFQLFPWTRNNELMYLLLYYVVVFVIILLFSLLVFGLLFVNELKKGLGKVLITVWSITIGPLFLPIVLTWLSMISCTNGNNAYVEEISCWSISHIIHTTIGWVLLLPFIAFTILASSTWTSRNLFNINSIDNKTTTKFDFIFVVARTLLAVVYALTNKLDNTSTILWILTLAYFAISSYVFLVYFNLQPHLDIYIRRWNWFALSLFLSCNFCLVLSKALQNTKYDGGLLLFVMSIVVLLCVFFLRDKDDYNIKVDTIKQHPKNENEAIKQIQSLLYIVSEYSTKRSARLLMNGYISQVEAKWTFNNWIDQDSVEAKNGDIKQNIRYIYDHIEQLFLNYLDLYCSSVTLRIEYALFLLKNLNKKNNALKEFIAIENCHNLGMAEDFFVYKYKRYIENHDDIITKVGERRLKDSGSKKVYHDIIYKNNVNGFKLTIKKISLLYMDFWNILLTSSQDNKDCLVKLNKIGKDIKKGTQEVNEMFIKWQIENPWDKEVLMLYSDFTLNVVNDKDKAVEYQKIITEIENEKETKIDSKCIDFSWDNSNIWNPTALTGNDLNQYIIISGNNENFGVIINMSLNLCSLLGYTKNLLIGRDYHEIMPLLYIKEHNKLLKIKVNEWKQKAMFIGNIDSYTTHEEIAKCREIEVFLLNRSRYLIPLRWKVAVISNEYNELYFVAEALTKPNNQSKESVFSKQVNVLVNTDFIIEHFTTNAIKLLGISDAYIYSNKIITDFIQEFNEEILKRVAENAKTTHECLLSLKQKIQSQCYLNQTQQVTWKINDKKISKLCLTVREERINNNVIGYIYSFTPVNVNENKNVLQGESDAKQTGCSAPSVENNNQNDKKVKIDKEFLPKQFSKFNLNPSKMSFFKDVDYDTVVLSKAEIKSLAMKKINDQNQNIDSINEQSGISESYDESESSQTNSDNISYSESNNNEGSEIDIDDNNQDNNWKTNKRLNKVELKNNISGDDSYYKVNMSMIKYSIYDFNKRILVPVDENNFISEIEWKMGEHGVSKKIKTNQMWTTSKNEDNSVTVHTTAGDSEEDTGTTMNKRQIIEKQINNAISKEEQQPSIQNLKLASYLSLLLLIGIGVGFLVIFVIAFKLLAENVLIIEYGFELLTTILRGYFLVMETSLLGYDKYTNKQSDVQLQYERLTNFIGGFANDISNKRNLIETTFINFDKNLTNLMKLENVKIGVLGNNLHLQTYSLTLNGAFAELSTAWLLISDTEIEDNYPTNKNVYYFLYNSCNSILTTQQLHNEYYLVQLNTNNNLYQIISATCFVGSFIILVFIYLIITYTYRKVIEKKESYLEVFFDIERQKLQMLFERVEFFNQKIQIGKNSTLVSNSKKLRRRKEMEWDDQSISIDNTSYEEDRDQTMFLNPEMVMTEQSQRSQTKNKSSKETQSLNMKIGIVLILIFAYLIVCFTIFILYLHNLKSVVAGFKAFYEFFYTYLHLYSNMRSYLFDEKLPFTNRPSSEFEEEILPNWYKTIHEKRQ